MMMFKVLLRGSVLSMNITSASSQTTLIVSGIAVATLLIGTAALRKSCFSIYIPLFIRPVNMN